MPCQADKGLPKATVTIVPAQLEHGIAELNAILPIVRSGCAWRLFPTASRARSFERFDD